MELIIVLLIVGLLIGAVLLVIGIYNGLKRKQVRAQTAWSDIDVQLKRRYDLIPNLVNTVKGYAAHEKETFENVTKARQQAIDASSIKDQVGAENMLTQALGRLLAVAEAYPDLKANQNFLALQEELTTTENKISFARQHYNRSVSQLNEQVQTFPSNVIAGMFNIREMDFFEIEDSSHRQAPNVEF